MNTFSSHNQDSAHRIVNVPPQPGICPENSGKTVHLIKCSVAYYDSLLCIRREGILLIFSTDNKQKNNFFNEMKCSFKLSSQTVQKYSVWSVSLEKNAWSSRHMVGQEANASFSSSASSLK
jgi:hypothetical protein